MQWAKKQTGFTIVELLIVIVVIAILAAITIVAYNGIQNRAKESSAQSAVSQAIKKIETFKSASTTASYPSSAAEAGIANIIGSSYFYDAIHSSYCVQVTNNQIAYSATNINPKPVVGACVENGLIGWWKLNGDGNDSTASGRAATLSTSIAVVDGQNGQAGGALEFDGTIPAARIPGSEDILTPENTFSFWYYADTWNGGAATSFVAKRSGTTTGHFIMRLTAGKSLSIDCGGSGNRWTTGDILPLNQWTHIVVACTPTDVSAYVNGVAAGPTDSPTPGTKIQTTGPLANNTILQFAQDGTAYSLDGKMDDIRLFNRAISAGEALRLYSDGAK